MSISIECKEIVKSFSGLRVLEHISISIPAASLFFLLGPSGCGKTTLLRIIAGLEEADSGQVLFEGQDIQHLPPDKRGVGMVFQNYALWPHMNVYKHLEFGLKQGSMTRHQIDQRIKQVLSMLQISQLSKRMPQQLSGGQQQRVSLARALALQPKVLLLDEPLSNLDPYLREEMRMELKAVQRELGLTFIYVTHDRAEALAIGDQIAFMLNGRIVQHGQPADLYFSPKTEALAGFLGDINIFECQPTAQGKFSFEFGQFSKPELNSEVKLGIRPEDIQINSEQQADYKSAAKVQTITPLGYAAQLNLQLNSGQKIRALTSMKNAFELHEGNNIEISFNSEDIKVLLG